MYLFFRAGQRFETSKYWCQYNDERYKSGTFLIGLCLDDRKHLEMFVDILTPQYLILRDINTFLNPILFIQQFVCSSRHTQNSPAKILPELQLTDFHYLLI